jgi:hypothetical protein
LRDAIEMEWVGIPSVAIVHEALAGSADAMKKMSKMPDYPYVKIPYPTQPTGIWPESECDAVVEALLPQLLDQLTTKREKVKAA